LDREIPQKWRNGILSKLIEVQNGFAFKSDEFEEQGTTPIVKIKNITPPNIDLSECQYFDGNVSKDDKLYKYLANYVDILISMTGSQMNQMNSAVGQVGRFNLKEPALINQRIGNLKPKKEMKCIEFVYRFISDKEIHYQLLTGSTGSANQANISPDQIKSLTIALPTPDVLEEFEDIGRCLMNRIVLNDETGNFLVKLKSLVMLNSLHGG
jgi:type I restriction enzyme S subunit